MSTCRHRRNMQAFWSLLDKRAGVSGGCPVHLVSMASALSVGGWPIVTNGQIRIKHECSCQEARHGCTPAFVFSIPGQVGFRTSLHHLISCRKLNCRQLRARVITGMEHKLSWLMHERQLLGCVRVQPTLYGAKRVVMRRRDFPALAHHLSSCPRESCAQLRRSLLLSVRESTRAEE